MRGYHEGQNKAYCCDFPSGFPTSERVDGDNESANQEFHNNVHQNIGGGCYGDYIHTCFSNELMTGVSVGNNDFLCGT